MGQRQLTGKLFSLTAMELYQNYYTSVGFYYHPADEIIQILQVMQLVFALP